ncbi:glycosyltransferase family 2 protein [Pelagibius sp. Alg239-R121]|uniref:glycosyltransferase family 2 protein n=1 Tax=Pelagibius sp. Alg239-R121 TaxID=2993448 RepID=UPI0024A73813|nr:glycosyltransferase family 2 protein [Pelagibius sp. Alg239-R121]
MEHRNRLSGLIVAHNEEEMIGDALRSLDFCDEIVVVLDKCTDGTRKIVEEFTSNILEGSWDIEGARRNFGIEACAGPFILELDADERVLPETAKEIREVVDEGIKGCYKIRFDNYVGNRLLRYGWAGSFGASAGDRLFAKGYKTWGLQRIHPSLELKDPIKELKGHITHLVDRDLNDMIKRLIWYTDMRAIDMAQKPLPPFRTVLRRACHRFLKALWGRKGYREGKMGFLLAMMAALYQLFSYYKALFIQEQRTQEQQAETVQSSDTQRTSSTP